MIPYDIKFFDVISRFWSGQSITRHLENMTWWHSYAYIFFVWSSMIIVAEFHSHANAIVFKYAKKNQLWWYSFQGKQLKEQL